MNGYEMKKRTLDALYKMREEYFSALFREYRLKDFNNQIWDIVCIEFWEKYIIFNLRLENTEEYKYVAVADIKCENVLFPYEFIEKDSK